MAEVRIEGSGNTSYNDPAASKNGAVPAESEARAKVKAPTMKQKIARAFIADEINDVKSYALFDVVIPSIKRVIRDLIMNAIDMTFYGKSKASRDPRDDRDATYVSYSRYSRRERDDRDDRDSRRDRESRSRGTQQIGIRDLDRVIFAEKEDAVDALSYLMDNIEEYGVASVADFLSSARLETTTIHQKWGWFDLQGSSVCECPDGSGWYVRMPKPRGI